MSNLNPLRNQVAPAAPTSGQTVTLYECKDVVAAGIIRVIVTFYSLNQASAALGLKSYGSANGGVNWDDNDFNSTMPATVSATAVGVDIRHDFDIAGYLGFKVTYTAGVTAPTVWRVSAVGLRGIRDSGQ